MKTKLILALFATLLLTACSVTPQDNSPQENTTETEQVQTQEESEPSVETNIETETSVPTQTENSNQTEASTQIETNSEVKAETPAQPETTSNEPTVATFTLAEIQTHNTKNDCYTTVDGKVYDITSYIPHHPGGERDIMKICGRDGSSMFGRQHGGDSKPEAKLASLYIGELTQ